MALGERVMVLEGLRMSRMLRHAQAVGAGGAGGKGIASLSGYSSIDCDTCLSVAEYEALAAQRRRLANRAITMQASAWRRAAQGGREARMAAEDAVIAAAAAKALAANADAKAMIARQLQTAPANVAHKLVAMVKELANRSAAILKSDRTEWLPGSGGYAAAMGPYSRPRKALAGIYIPSELKTTSYVATADELAARAAEAEAIRQAESAANAAMPINELATAAQLREGEEVYEVGPLTGDHVAIYARQTDGRGFTPLVLKGTYPFLIRNSLQFYYNKATSTLRIKKHTTDAGWMASAAGAVTDATRPALTAVADAVADAAATAAAAAETLAKDAICFAAKKAAAAAMAALHCGEPPYANTIDCRAGAAAQAEILRRAGCTPPKEIEDAAGPPASSSKFGGAITIAIPALLAVLLLGGK